MKPTINSVRSVRATRALVLAVAVFALPGYECGDVIEDPGFDLWCGDKLCNWELERGMLDRVPTWHESDHGVELVGDDVAISQLVDINQDETRCIRFELIADIENTATVFVDMDTDDDGDVEFSRQIPTSDWAPLQYLVDLPPVFSSLRFRISKTGPGRAVLAEIEAIKSDECVGEPGGQ